MNYKKIIKQCILDELTIGEYCLFDKKRGYARYNNTNLTMVMDSIVAGIMKANEVIEKDTKDIISKIEEDK